MSRVKHFSRPTRKSAYKVVGEEEQAVQVQPSADRWSDIPSRKQQKILVNLVLLAIMDSSTSFSKRLAAVDNCKNVLTAMLIYLTCSSTIFIQKVSGADPDPLVDLTVAANISTGFVLRDIWLNGAVSTGAGGVRAALNTGIFPGLTSQGLTVVMFRMVPCGENVPHTHPRATEVLSLISGGPLQAGFVDTTGQAHIEVLFPGDIIVFPRGLLHFELNVGTTEAFYISALNSQNPGTLDSAGAVLNLPERAAAIALNQTLETIRFLRSQRVYNEPPTLEAALAEVCVPGQNITAMV